MSTRHAPCVPAAPAARRSFAIPIARTVLRLQERQTEQLLHAETTSSRTMRHLAASPLAHEGSRWASSSMTTSGGSVAYTWRGGRPRPPEGAFAVPRSTGTPGAAPCPPPQEWVSDGRWIRGCPAHEAQPYRGGAVSAVRAAILAGSPRCSHAQTTASNPIAYLSSASHGRAAGCENDQVQIVIRVTRRAIHPTLKTVLKAPVVAPQASLSA